MTMTKKPSICVTLLLCLWACGTTSDTVRQEPNQQSSKDLVGTWQYMKSDRNGKLVPILAYPGEDSTTIKKIVFSSNKTWHRCDDSTAFGTYIVQGSKISFRRDWKRDAQSYSGVWVLQGNTLELVFDAGYIDVLARATACKN